MLVTEVQRPEPPEVTTKVTNHGTLRRGKMTVRTITPSEARQAEVADEAQRPTVLVPGFFANRDGKVMQEVGEDVAQLTGQEVHIVSFSGLHRGRKLSEGARERIEAHDVDTTRIKKARWRSRGRMECPSRYEYNRAAQVAAYLEDRDITDARVVAHSLGNQAAFILSAEMAPDRVIEMAGVTPTVLLREEEYPLRLLATRFFANTFPETVRNLNNPAMRRLVMASARALLHPRQVLLHERGTIRDTDLHAQIDALNADPEDLTAAFVVGSEDAVFGNAVEHESVTAYDGGHNAIITKKDFVPRVLLPLFERAKPRTS